MVQVLEGEGKCSPEIVQIKEEVLVLPSFLRMLPKTGARLSAILRTCLAARALYRLLPGFHNEAGAGGVFTVHVQPVQEEAEGVHHQVVEWQHHKKQLAGPQH